MTLSKTFSYKVHFFHSFAFMQIRRLRECFPLNVPILFKCNKYMFKMKDFLLYHSLIFRSLLLTREEMMIGSESIFLHQNKLAKPYLKRQLARFNDHNEIRRTHARGNREIEVDR